MSDKQFDGIQYARERRDEERAREDKKDHAVGKVADAILFNTLGGPITRAALGSLWNREPKHKPEQNEQIESD
jgi:hypothetical protein